MKNSPYYNYYLFSVFLVLLLVVVIPQGVRGWDDEDLDNDMLHSVVNVVKDVNMRNFYKLLDLPQNATQQEIRRSWRRIALVHHPDKNLDDPNANEKFRQLSAVHEVLKSTL